MEAAEAADEAEEEAEVDVSAQWVVARDVPIHFVLHKEMNIKRTEEKKKKPNVKCQ